jgi:hypothetical protein
LHEKKKTYSNLVLRGERAVDIIVTMAKELQDGRKEGDV